MYKPLPSRMITASRKAFLESTVSRESRFLQRKPFVATKIRRIGALLSLATVVYSVS